MRGRGDGTGQARGGPDPGWRLGIHGSGWVQEFVFLKSVEVILLRSQVRNHRGRIWGQKEEQRKSKETDRAARGQREAKVAPTGVSGKSGRIPRAEPRGVL